MVGITAERKITSPSKRLNFPSSKKTLSNSMRPTRSRSSMRPGVDESGGWNVAAAAAPALGAVAASQCCARADWC